MLPSSIHCEHFGICSICHSYAEPLLVQQEKKKQHLSDLLSAAGISYNRPLQLENLGAGLLRTRADLTIERGKIGFYSAAKERGLVDIQNCQQMSPELQKVLHKVREFDFQVKKASLRIRCSPAQKAGVWLDFANKDIQNLFSQKSLLLKLLDEFEVEVGQKKKKLFYDGEKLRLRESDLLAWTQAHLKSQEIDLFSQIGSFTQTGPLATAVISKLIREEIKKNERILEFGCGIGTFTFTLAEENQVQAFEFDGLALAGLKKTLASHADFGKRISLHQGNYHKIENSPDFEDCNLVFINPARSGVGDFFANMKDPRPVIYLSCYPESFVKDSLALQSKGLLATRLVIVDQFPMTHHYEIFSVWKPAKAL